MRSGGWRSRRPLPGRPAPGDERGTREQSRSPSDEAPGDERGPREQSRSPSDQAPGGDRGVLSIGSVFAEYRIERLLGAGGMGTVYLARNPELPRSDALKVLSAELSRDPGFRGRFIREADVASSLDHPNIVSVHRRGEFNGQLWIAMQFVDGTDADNALRTGTLTPPRAVHIVSQVAKALDYAHQRGVIHRDVKPANFLLSGPIGPDERVLLGDFGIARALSDVGLTVTGSVIATLSYAAPEVLNGQPIDGRSDVYSLGCTLFRMLTGQMPFAGAEGVGGVMAAHLHAPPPRVTDRMPGFSPRMDAVIATAMAKDPARRFQTAQQLSAAAADALNDNRLSATAPWQQPQPWQQPRPPTYQVQPAPWFVPPPPDRRRRRWIAASLAVAVVAAVAAAVVLASTLRTHRDAAPANNGESTSPTSTTAPQTPVSVSALPGLLLLPEQVATIIGAAGTMTTVPTRSTLYDDSAEISEKDCLGAFGAAEHATYGDSGWTGAQLQYMRDENFEHEAFQGLIAFPTAETAQKLVAAQQALWAKCAHRNITLTKPTGQQHRILGPLVNADGVLSMTSVMQESAGRGCQHALSARNNVVIDTNVCRQDVTNQAVDLLKAIAAKISP
jgi:eukaryotic-like serine/threonine-protein kinase